MKRFFENKSVLVMGLGRFAGGADSADFACDAGAKTTVTDLVSEHKLKQYLEKLKHPDQIEFHLGQHTDDDFKNNDIIIVNPAVPKDNKYLQIARDNNKKLTSQVEIFFQLCPAKIIGITGSNGKSTTTALTHHILKNSLNDKNVYLTGNIGNKPMLTLLDKLTTSDIVVAELSSFQLEQLANTKDSPHIALITNLTPNHLDRHKTFENYCDAKENIFKYQNNNSGNTPVSIFCEEDKKTLQWFDKYKKDNKRISLTYSADQVSELLKQNFKLPGHENLTNLAGAVTIAKQLNITDTQIADTLNSFNTLDHRLQLVTEINGVKFYNDSIATTPESTIVALNAFDSPKILIAGGYDKQIAFDQLAENITEKVKIAILIGQTAKAIAKNIKNTDIIYANSLTDAVQLAYQKASPGDIILLSPACASYDMFDNFQQRGQIFTQAAKQLKKNL